MTHQINVTLARAIAAERAARWHSFTCPVVREVPRPVGPQTLDPGAW